MTDADADSQTDTETERVWLVERSYDDRNLITLVYATPAGDRAVRKELAATVIHHQGTRITAAIDAPTESLEPVADADRERFATEAERMQTRHDPDDEV